MPKASTIFSGKFELDRKGFQSTENIGRPEGLGDKKKSNPFEWKSFEKDPLSSNKNITNESENIPFTKNQTRTILNRESLLFLRSFNSLKHRNHSSCHFEDAKQLDNLYINSSTSNCFCQTIYHILNTISPDTRLLFSQISPMLLGKIVFAPNTPAYRNLIKRANSTFENMETILKYFGSLADLGKYILKLINLDKHALDLLKENVITLAEELKLNRTINFEDILLQTEATIEQLDFVRNLGYCVELDKFVGFENEEEATKIGGHLLDKSNLWGAFIFENTELIDENGASQLPNKVTYKIRMNSSLTHNTFYTQDKFYFYGPSNCIRCNSYFLYGFIYMQDILEKGSYLDVIFFLILKEFLRKLRNLS